MSEVKGTKEYYAVPSCTRHLGETLIFRSDRKYLAAPAGQTGLWDITDETGEVRTACDKHAGTSAHLSQQGYFIIHRVTTITTDRELNNGEL